MLEGLTDRFQILKRKVLGYGRITRKELDSILKEIKLTLFEADVNYKVVKNFIDHLSEKTEKITLSKSLNPGDAVIRAVYEELVGLLGETEKKLEFKGGRPLVISLLGLQGAGKTTTAAKIALKYRGHRPLLVPADAKRPAAIEQLKILGERINIPVFPFEGDDPILTVKRALKMALNKSFGLVIIDTAGRLHIDENLIGEVNKINDVAGVDYRLIVADGMTGQDAVNQAKAFKEKVGLEGAILTKMDGDARGGAALSIVHAAHIPIFFIGTSEHLEGLENFYPKRIAQRILGMGDVTGLVERVKVIEKEIDQERLRKKAVKGEINLEDFLEQLKAVKKLGPIAKIAAMMPGVKEADVDENEFKKIEAIINSMTKRERRHPEILDGSRKRRIALGSGTRASDINQLLKQFSYARDLLKKFGKGKLPKGIRLPY